MPIELLYILFGLSVFVILILVIRLILMQVYVAGMKATLRERYRLE